MVDLKAFDERVHGEVLATLIQLGLVQACCGVCEHYLSKHYYDYVEGKLVGECVDCDRRHQLDVSPHDFAPRLSELLT